MKESLDSQRERYLHYAAEKAEELKLSKNPTIVQALRGLARVDVDADLVTRIDAHIEKPFRNIVLNKKNIPITAEDLNSVIKATNDHGLIWLFTTYGNYIVDPDNRVFPLYDDKSWNDASERDIMRRYHPRALAEAYSEAIEMKR